MYKRQGQYSAPDAGTSAVVCSRCSDNTVPTSAQDGCEACATGKAFVQGNPSEASCQATSDNLALSKTVTAGGHFWQDNRSPERAVDGRKPQNTDKCWMTADGAADDEKWLKIDMGEVVWVNRMVAMNYDESGNGRYTHDWTLEASLNDATWTQVASGDADDTLNFSADFTGTFGLSLIHI